MQLHSRMTGMSLALLLATLVFASPTQSTDWESKLDATIGPKNQDVWLKRLSAISPK